MKKNNIKLQRVVMEVFGGCNYTCQMCPQSNPGRGKNFTRKMPVKVFEEILDKIVPKYGSPIINLQGSGEPTMAKDLSKIIQADGFISIEELSLAGLLKWKLGLDINFD